MSWLARLEGVGRKDLTIIDDGTGFIPADYGKRLAAVLEGSGEGLLSANVVMSPVNWILRNFTEAETVVEKLVEGKTRWELAPADEPLAMRLADPNPYYGDSLLWKATVLSDLLDGNGYWQKVRNAFDEVLGYWYLPHFLMEPKWPQDNSVFISHYEYSPPQGEKIKFAVRDVVHFRFGLDPRNIRKGLSPLKPLLREVFTDEEASSFAAAILSNMGVPGGLIAPTSNDALPSEEDIKAMKAYMRNFRGSQRGEWFVAGQPTDIKQFGFDPNNLMLGSLRDMAEERVCAALGIPAAVVGFGSGLQQTKVGATMRELRKEAWDSGIRPLQNDLAKQLTRQVIPDFYKQTRRYRVRFDPAAFSASQEQESEKADRLGKLVERGVISVDVAQQELGYDVDPARKGTYLGPTPAPDEPPEPAAPVTNGGNGATRMQALLEEET